MAHLDHGHALHQTGVVYQNVHRADLGLDLCHHGVYGVLVGNVCHIAVGVDAGSLVGGKTFLQTCLGGAVEADGCTALGHALGDGEADAVGTAGDQSNLALQVERGKIHDFLLLKLNNPLSLLRSQLRYVEERWIKTSPFGRGGIAQQ